MENSYLENKIKEIVAEALTVPFDKVTLDANLVGDLGADSLDLVELIMSLEEAFSTPSLKVEISDEDAEKIATIQGAIDFLKELGIKDE